MVWTAARKKWMGRLDEFEWLEQHFGGPDPDELVARYRAAVEVLQNGGLDEWLAHAEDQGLANGAADHFRNDWLEGPRLVQVPGNSMTSAIKDGFLPALEAGAETGLPLTIAWVAPDELDPGYFDVSHVVGHNGITVVVVSGPPELSDINQY